MISHWKNILICCLVILLILSNIYYLNYSQVIWYEILVGVPTMNGTGTDFSQSTPLSNEEQIEMVLFSMLNSNMIPKPAIADNRPSAVVWINAPREGITYLRANVWLDRDVIVFLIENTEHIEYRVVNSTYYASQLKKIIEDQIYRYT